MWQLFTAHTGMEYFVDGIISTTLTRIKSHKSGPENATCTLECMTEFQPCTVPCSQTQGITQTRSACKTNASRSCSNA